MSVLAPRLNRDVFAMSWPFPTSFSEISIMLHYVYFIYCGYGQGQDLSRTHQFHEVSARTRCHLVYMVATWIWKSYDCQPRRYQRFEHVHRLLLLLHLSHLFRLLSRSGLCAHQQVSKVTSRTCSHTMQWLGFGQQGCDCHHSISQNSEQMNYLIV